MTISLKNFGIILVILVAGLLLTHWIMVGNVREEAEIELNACNQQVESLEVQVESLIAEHQILETRLGLESIRGEVLQSNFGTAKEMVKDFNAMLAEKGCSKLDQLYPVFETLEDALNENRGSSALVSLEEAEAIIFED